MREELANTPHMKVCAVSNLQNVYGPCARKIDFDHVWTYAGRQINELWAILGVCERHHRMKDGNQLLKDTIWRTSLRLASETDLAKYPRKNWKQIKLSLGMTP